MSKRSRPIDTFFTSPAKKIARIEDRSDKDQAVANGIGLEPSSVRHSVHSTYPFAIPHLPKEVDEKLDFAPASEARIIDDDPDLDLLYYQPYIPREIQRSLFEFLRRELFFYRVQYAIKRGMTETLINTPRYTTVFGLDETSRFTEAGEIVDAVSGQPLAKNAYKGRPRPIPQCLDRLRFLTENATECKFNFALVNYYASGNDSISYHSDDERFLGKEPAIASFSLGAKRDFLMRHKKTPAGHSSETKPLKLPLGSGDMILMRGKTQSNWEHSIPKRKGGEADLGRINITFRRALVKGGTENYYRYNVGDGAPLKWDETKREMLAATNGSTST